MYGSIKVHFHAPKTWPTQLFNWIFSGFLAVLGLSVGLGLKASFKTFKKKQEKVKKQTKNTVIIRLCLQ